MRCTSIKFWTQQEKTNCFIHYSPAITRSSACILSFFFKSRIILNQQHTHTIVGKGLNYLILHYMNTRKVCEKYDCHKNFVDVDT